MNPKLWKIHFTNTVYFHVCRFVGFLHPEISSPKNALNKIET